MISVEQRRQKTSDYSSHLQEVTIRLTCGNVSVAKFGNLRVIVHTTEQLFRLFVHRNRLDSTAVWPAGKLAVCLHFDMVSVILIQRGHHCHLEQVDRRSDALL